MRVRILRLYVSSRTAVQNVLTDERGALGDYVSTAMLVGLSVATGLAIIAFVPGVIHTWVSNLLTSCLPTSGAATATTCP